LVKNSNLQVQGSINNFKKLKEIHEKIISSQDMLTEYAKGYQNNCSVLEEQHKSLLTNIDLMTEQFFNELSNSSKEFTTQHTSYIKDIKSFISKLTEESKFNSVAQSQKINSIFYNVAEDIKRNLEKISLTLHDMDDLNKSLSHTLEFNLDTLSSSLEGVSKSYPKLLNETIKESQSELMSATERYSSSLNQLGFNLETSINNLLKELNSFTNTIIDKRLNITSTRKSPKKTEEDNS